MLLKLLFVIAFHFKLTASITSNGKLLDIPDYQYNLNSDEKPALRKTFLNKKKQNDREKFQLEFLNRLAKNDTTNIIYDEDIPHYEINGAKKYLRIKRIEYEFLNLLEMKGFKYSYKRDKYWRTWRIVRYPDGKPKLVNYRFQNECNVTKEKEVCNDIGIWLIEENPLPCPYEILSMKKSGVYCVVKNTQLHQVLNACPLTIQDADITGICENPIVTHWQFERDFSQRNFAKYKYSNILSGGKPIFELITVYRLSNKAVTFRIVNSTYKIIYSRIMLKNRRNFACVENCGTLDPEKLRVVKKEKPMTVDLMKPSKPKNKREEACEKKSWKEKRREEKKRKEFEFFFPEAKVLNILPTDHTTPIQLEESNDISWAKDTYAITTRPATADHTTTISPEQSNDISWDKDADAITTRPATLSPCKEILRSHPLAPDDDEYPLLNMDT